MFTSNLKPRQDQPFTLPAVYVIFTLLNAIRRGVERKNIWREFRRQGIALKPRLSFWVAVCKEAGLLKEAGQLKVTGYARRWLNKTSEEQMFLLIESWQNAPKNRKARQFRKKLLWKLKYDKPLTRKDLGVLNGLEALGLITPHVSLRDGETCGGSENQLTTWGRFFINSASTPPKSSEAGGVRDKGELPTPKPIEPCTIHEDHFIASIPQHVDLLWELENHLRPNAPGKYPLTKRALHFYEGDPHKLIDLIERGLRAEIPGPIKARLLRQPSIRIAEGTVLEFSSPLELRQLRRQPVFRKYIDEFLSPQRVLVSNQNAKVLFQMLKRRGVYMHGNQRSTPQSGSVDEQQVEARKKRTHFPSQAKALLQPMGSSVPKLTIIEKYKQLEQGLDILYRTPGYAAEPRRITPLLVEQRGEQTYVIAYCQTRRAQRTFRLDRIEIPGAW